MAGAVPNRKVKKAVDTGADPSTWDWQPINVRNELKQGKLKRKCNDGFWAIAFLLTIGALIGFAVYGFMHMDWDGKSFKSLVKKSDQDASGADSAPAPKDDEYDAEDFKWAEGFIWKMVLQLGLASAFGLVFAFMWTCALRACAGKMIKMSIFVFLGLQVAMICVVAPLFSSGTAMMAIAGLLGLSLLIHVLYFWCVWKRIPMAEATLSIATRVSSKYHCVYWLGLLFSLLSIAFIFAWFFGAYGLYQFCGFDVDLTDVTNGKTRFGSFGQ